MRMNSMKILKRCLCFVLVLMSLVSMISFIPDNHVHAASASDYISQSYASNITVKTTKTVNLMSFPTTASGSSAKYSLPKDTVLTVKALHKNTDGAYWYEVLYYNLTLYIDATATTMLAHLTGDVSITGASSPASLTYGNGFPIKGDIKATRNNIGKITAAMYNGTDITRKPALSSSATVNGKSYSLTNSTIDKNLIFSDLAKGSYTYMVTAEAISYYINSSGALTTSVTPVVLQKNICVVTNGSSPNPVLHNGIDISVWNGNIDFTQVKNQVDFVIIRASWETTADTKFVTNANGCRDNGIPFGVYVYSYAESAAEAIAEAKYVLTLVDNYDMDLPIFFDFEDECAMNLGASKQQEICKAFCDTIYAGGHQPGIYTYTWILRSVLTDSYYRSIPMWTAEINGASYTSYKGGLWMWQWSWVGRFNGMSGDVDCNKMYVDLPNQNKSDTSYLSKCTYYPANSNATTNTTTNFRQYPSTDYSILSTLNSGTNVHVTGLYKNSYGNYWYQVEKDGVVGYIGAENLNIKSFRYDDVAVRDPDMASNLDVGKGYYIKGKLSSIYNQLSTVNAKIFSGENTLGSPTLKSSYSTTKKDYNLYKSNVDYGLNFGLLSAGYYTYEISVDAKNYYYNGSSLVYETKNVVVWTKPFTVGGAAITPPESNVCVHNIVTDQGKVPTCTEAGLTIGTRCTLCGEVISKQETIPALGHSYEVKVVDATCQTAAYYEYTCSNCTSQYREYVSGVGLSDHKFSRGRCLVCDYVCTHQWENGKCNLCLMSCMHKWSNGECTICKQPCVHSWQNGVCTTCSYVCAHNWQNGSCADCGMGCAHNWVDNTCTKCGYICSPHVYNNGVCYICKTPCPGHQWEDSTCTICMMNCPHNWQDGTCADCGSTCAHSWLNGLCAHCGAQCTHNWVNGKCSKCSYICRHNYIDGYCQDCSYKCSHNWHNGICTSCSMRCYHHFKNGVCTSCSLVCSHNWKNGVCSQCSMTCSHSWKTNGVCSVCNAICSHNWEEGKCTVCLKDCKHVWYNGKCQLCKLPCTHDWEDSVCTLCGNECKHTWVDGTCVECTVKCEHFWLDGYCRICLEDCDHQWFDSTCSECAAMCENHYYVDGVCTICSAAEPEYYLFGYIDGKDYGTGIDIDNIGTYKFEDGKLVATFKYDSFVGVKTGDNNIFYMTNGYQGDKINYAVLYDSYMLGDKADKLFVPRGREITFTLTYIDSNTLTLSYEAAPCEHKNHDMSGYCSDCMLTVDHTYLNGECSVCSKVCNHSFEKNECTICHFVCGHIWNNGVCVVCSTVCTHKWADGICVNCGKDCDHKWIQGGCINCGYNCEHSYSDGVCNICSYICYHTFADGFCTECGSECVHIWVDGECQYCSITCAHSWKAGECIACGTKCNHTYTKDKCTNCQVAKYYLVGYINKVAVGYNEDYENLGQFALEGGSVTVNVKYDSYFFVKTSDNKNWYMASESVSGMFALLENTKNGNAYEMIFMPAGVTAEFSVYEGKNDTVGFVYTIDSCIHTLHDTDGICVACEEEVDHNYSGGWCKVCHAQKPQQNMYLFGVINGEDYGYNMDYATIGDYKLLGNTLLIKFETDSYVGIKTQDNEDWYMTNGKCAEGATSAVLENTRAGIDANLFMIPGGMEVAITISNNGNDTYTLSYVSTEKPLGTINNKYATLTTQGEFRYNIYFTVTTEENVEVDEIGLLIFSENNANGTINSAAQVISVAYTEGTQMYVMTDAIEAQCLAETMYMKVYAKLSDGSYVYGDIIAYSGVTHANNVLSSKYSTASEKALMASLLNFIAAAQKFNTCTPIGPAN